MLDKALLFLVSLVNLDTRGNRGWSSRVLLIDLKNGKGGGTSTNSFNLCSSIILRHLSELIQVDIFSQQVMLSHLLGMNLKNLESTFEVWESNLKMDLKSAWS